jgi:SEC-C motif-containing protein
MRSRFAAFARGEVDYLVRTLHPDHRDLVEQPREALVRALRDAVRRYRYMRLEVLDVHPPDAAGVARVRFRAHVFEKGKDRSFTELSDFARDGTGWRYLSGAPDPS